MFKRMKMDKWVPLFLSVVMVWAGIDSLMNEIDKSDGILFIVIGSAFAIASFIFKSSGSGAEGGSGSNDCGGGDGGGGGD
jgi:uncharacterized membrane protein YgcG